MLFTDFSNWWEIVGSKMKNEPGENINDTELPLRIARSAWDAVLNIENLQEQIEQYKKDEISWRKKAADNDKTRNYSAKYFMLGHADSLKKVISDLEKINEPTRTA